MPLNLFARDKAPSRAVLGIVAGLSSFRRAGESRPQKKFTVDFLQHKMKDNIGEFPQYYIEHSHDAIIPPEDWEQVQFEMVLRKSLGRRYSEKNVCGARLKRGAAAV